MAESPFWDELYAYCRSFDGAVEEHPWDHVDFRVKGKTFVFTSGDRPVVTITAKPFPENRDMFLQLPGVSVAAYVGRFGWLTVQIQDQAGFEMAKDMIAESYAVLTAKKKAAGKR
ncbi:MAG TPA: MmcQ/YjbR family DNA-binding protein [Symbiobacteriaceae bacterium]|nr:MmcQ/YjbR family DNA-binding protein [Symbiobacteriaceae bacterium]